MANIIVVVDNNRDSTLRGCFGWGGRKLYVAGKYMAELTDYGSLINWRTFSEVGVYRLGAKILKWGLKH